MKKLLNSISNKVRDRFTDLDLAFLKTYAAIPGLILGAYFPEFIKSILWVLVSVFSILFLRYCYLLFFYKADTQ